MIGYDPATARKKSPETKVSFTPPPGLGLETKQEGDEMELVAKVRVEKGGNVCLVALNGIPFGKANKTEPQPEPTTKSDAPEDFTTAVERRASTLPQ